MGCLYVKHARVSQLLDTFISLHVVTNNSNVPKVPKCTIIFDCVKGEKYVK
jgi:hypothetical protein